jgi:predicted Zn-dependent protease with MMP-like domain
MVEVSRERFEELVADALDSIPAELGSLMDNVAVVVEAGSDRGLLGLYQGVPLTKRDGGYGSGMVMPDRITIYQRSICAHARDEADVVNRVRVTVIHEVGHHFGIDDARLRELGWA